MYPTYWRFRVPNTQELCVISNFAFSFVPLITVSPNSKKKIVKNKN